MKHEEALKRVYVAIDHNDTIICISYDFKKCEEAVINSVKSSNHKVTMEESTANEYLCIESDTRAGFFQWTVENYMVE